MEVSETITIPDISVVRPGMSEATSLGAAIAAGTAIGVWNKQESALVLVCMIQTILKALSKIHLNSVKEFDHKTPMTGWQFRLRDDDLRAQDVGGGEGDKVH